MIEYKSGQSITDSQPNGISGNLNITMEHIGGIEAIEEPVPRHGVSWISF